MISWPWNKPKFYRHGDLLLRQVDKIPESATQLSTNIIAHGENGNRYNRDTTGNYTIEVTISLKTVIFSYT